MKEFKMDFYSTTNLKSYDLNDSMRYQLAMLDSLDVFTRVHSENVANLTCRICEKLHMKNYFIVYATICAYLHDIGKQFIPPAILQKPSRLTDEEYSKIKTHTTIGYQMCMRDEKLRPYAAGPLYHHEALNGTGYPNKVSGKDLPLVGQIIRVADEYDAITSKRQYKSHVGSCETINILIDETHPNKNLNEKTGKLNPKIVKALIKVIIDDTEYEIYNLGLYLDYIKDELKRLNQISDYIEKLNKEDNPSKKEYYLYCIKELSKMGETIENHYQVVTEHQEAYELRNSEMNNLRSELKQLKKMKV